MNISLTYSKYSIHHLAALAAACSKSVSLYENKENSHTLSMGPFCDKITSQNSIICLLLNFDPIEEKLSNQLLLEVKFIRPTLYNIYRRWTTNAKDTANIANAQKCLDFISEKFESELLTSVRPLELVLWADLYLFFSERSPFVKLLNNTALTLPPKLIEWFHVIDKLIPLRRAAKIALGDNEEEGLILSVQTLPNLPIRDFHVNVDVAQSCIIIDDDAKDIFLHGYTTVEAQRVFSAPKLPLPNTRNILITSALPYVNNVPHLGNLIGSTLSADVFSRYCRARGYNSIYVCGTDEYGTATEVKAAEENVTPREICDRYYAIHADVYRWFEIDFDIFGRTSDKAHAKVVTEVFEDINRRGFILEDCVQQLFCEKCDRFLADRFVEGGCPMCGYDDARGDQCDKCGKLINAIELTKPRCKLCSSSPCIKSSQHLFLDLVKIQDDLETFLRGRMNADDCIWSTNAKSITRAWLKEGLKPRCITRDLKWGVPVPLEKFKSKVFYVWFDAVLGYLSITASYTDDWRQWWLQDEAQGEVQLYQFMAKDNVPFHSVILPANLMATGQRYTVLRQLASTEYLNYENDKFSKSRSIGVFGPDAQASGIEADIWRFYLVTCRPENQDSSFLWEDFAARNNSELLNNIGNFVHRALTFVVKFFDGLVPDFEAGLTADDAQFIRDVNSDIRQYVDSMEQMKMRDAVAALLSIGRLGNGYFQRNEPWASVKAAATRARAGTVVGVAANISVVLGVLMGPIMPCIGDRLLTQCQAPSVSRQIIGDCKMRAFLRPGHKIGEVVHLFTKMEDSFVKEMREKFAGNH